MELKRMMEKLGQAKTHLELKKMIAEVDTTNSGTCLTQAVLVCNLQQLRPPGPSWNCGPRVNTKVWGGRGGSRRENKCIMYGSNI